MARRMRSHPRMNEIRIGIASLTLIAAAGCGLGIDFEGTVHVPFDVIADDTTFEDVVTADLADNQDYQDNRDSISSGRLLTIEAEILEIYADNQASAGAGYLYAGKAGEMLVDDGPERALASFDEQLLFVGQIIPFDMTEARKAVHHRPPLPRGRRRPEDRRPRPSERRRHPRLPRAPQPRGRVHRGPLDHGRYVLMPNRIPRTTVVRDPRRILDEAEVVQVRADGEGRGFGQEGVKAAPRPALEERRPCPWTPRVDSPRDRRRALHEEAEALVSSCSRRTSRTARCRRRWRRHRVTSEVRERDVRTEGEGIAEEVAASADEVDGRQRRPRCSTVSPGPRPSQAERPRAERRAGLEPQLQRTFLGFRSSRRSRGERRTHENRFDTWHAEPYVPGAVRSHEAKQKKAGEQPAFRTKRRRRDSNPRYSFPYTGLANQRLKPLGHLSKPVVSGTKNVVGSGAGGIRTPGTLPYGGFQNRCLRPLGHCSKEQLCISRTAEPRNGKAQRQAH